MVEHKIILHKEVSTDGTYVPSFTLKLSVSETSEGLTPCIFVHEYIPKNPGTGKVSYDFCNVAYYDELTEVKDYVEDKKHSCLVRRSCIIKSFRTYDELTEFLTTVQHDVQRLIQQLSTLYVSGECELINVTSDAIVTVDCPDNEDVSDLPGESDDSDVARSDAIVLSFDGKLKK